MDLEERTREQVGDRCEECGVELTAAEQETVLETGGPALCTIHAAELAAVDEDDDELLDADV
jgi:hypothetical protein